LLVHRTTEGLHLACRDLGGLQDKDSHLTPNTRGLNLSAESGRGLAMVDALSTSWGDNGNAMHRTVWFYLAYDLANSQWNTTDPNGRSPSLPRPHVDDMKRAQESVAARRPGPEIPQTPTQTYVRKEDSDASFYPLTP